MRIPTTVMHRALPFGLMDWLQRQQKKSVQAAAECSPARSSIFRPMLWIVIGCVRHLDFKTNHLFRAKLNRVGIAAHWLKLSFQSVYLNIKIFNFILWSGVQMSTQLNSNALWIQGKKTKCVHICQLFHTTFAEMQKFTQHEWWGIFWLLTL